MSRINRLEYKDWKGFGARVRKARESIGMTREKLADMINRTENYILSLEKGDKGCSVHTLHQICVALKISANYLLYGDDDMRKIDNGKTDKEILKEIIERVNDQEAKVLKEVIVAIYPNLKQIIEDKEQEK